MTNAEQTRKLSLLLGIVILCFLAGGSWMWFRITSQGAPASTSPAATPWINVPQTEYATIPSSAPAFTISIHSVGSSGITGRATFKDVAGSAAILLHVDGLSEENEESIIPAELRYGTCAAPGALAYLLAAPDAGESETDLSIDLKQFDAQKPMAIVLYRSSADHTAIACGDIP